jgi:Tol biopolymer transport system component
MAAVWTDAVVTDETLTRAVSQIRRTFGDRAAEPEVVETIRGTGYRWVAPRATPPEASDAKRDAAASPSNAEASAEAGAAPQTAAARDTASALLGRPLPVGVAVVLGVVLGALIAWGGWMWWQDGTPARSSSTASLLTPTPFTTYAGVEMQPAVAPDGQRVAFVWHRAGTPEDSADVYVKQPGTEAPLRLTNQAGLESMPRWSPDGTQVAFIRETGDGAVVKVVPAIGGAERTLLRTDAPWFGGLDWTPDGDALVVADRPAPGRPYRLVRLDLASRDTTHLTAPPATTFGDLLPTVAPDGRSVAFVRRARGQAGRLYRTAVRRPGTPKQLGTGWQRVNGLDWAPDGTALVVAAARPGTDEQLWRVDATDGTATPLPLRQPHARYPSVAGGTLVFQATDAAEDIWRFRLPVGDEAVADTTGGGTPFITSTREDDKPVVAPGGQHVAFASSRSGTDQLWRAGPEGQSPVQLTTFDGAQVGRARWSPGGEWLAFTADTAASGASRAGTRSTAAQQLYLVRAEGGPARTVPFGGGTVAVEDWHATGLYVASDRSGQWQIWRVPPSVLNAVQAGHEAVSAQAELVTQAGGTRAQVDPQGEALFVVRPDTSGLWRLPLTGGPATRVVDDPALGTWTPWTVTADAIVYAADRGERAAVVRIDRATGTRRVLATLPIEGSDWALTPDGRALLYTRLQDVRSDLYRVGWPDDNALDPR